MPGELCAQSISIVTLIPWQLNDRMQIVTYLFWCQHLSLPNTDGSWLQKIEEIKPGRLNFHHSRQQVHCDQKESASKTTAVHFFQSQAMMSDYRCADGLLKALFSVF